MMRAAILFWILALLPLSVRAATHAALRLVRIKDIASVEGVRDNPLVGYGMVVGLNGTGDRRQTIFSTQTLANILRRMGLQIPASSVRVNNVAAVMVTATLPPFARPGMRLDVTVSSVGDAKSLEGGLLLLTSLYGADGQMVASAQGPLVLGGYTAGGRGNSIQINHPTTARIAAGAIVERDATVELARLPRLSLLMREADFSTAQAVAQAINLDAGRDLALAVDARRVDLRSQGMAAEAIPGLLARVEELTVVVQSRARVVVNERTGTIVLGRDVSLGACSILHGNLTVEISTDFDVSQPAPFSQGTTEVVPKTTVRAAESSARKVELGEGATVDDLIAGLQQIGATARDVVAILEALKAAGALGAELEVL
jgi:flagellar P-ring protein precursor FlgI